MAPGSWPTECMSRKNIAFKCSQLLSSSDREIFTLVPTRTHTHTRAFRALNAVMQYNLKTPHLLTACPPENAAFLNSCTQQARLHMKAERLKPIQLRPRTFSAGVQSPAFYTSSHHNATQTHALTVGPDINTYTRTHARTHTNMEKYPSEGKRQNMIFIYLITFSHSVHSKRHALLKKPL